MVFFGSRSHVDRSITDPLAFCKTNVIGTMNLLNVCGYKVEKIIGMVNDSITYFNR
jgi:dTDP-D-glucose 4,6-dehydratase